MVSLQKQLVLQLHWCRGDVGCYAQFILTFTPILGIGWFVASHGWVASHRYGFPLEAELVLQLYWCRGFVGAIGGSRTTGMVFLVSGGGWFYHFLICSLLNPFYPLKYGTSSAVCVRSRNLNSVLCQHFIWLNILIVRCTTTHLPLLCVSCMCSIHISAVYCLLVWVMVLVPVSQCCHVD